MANSYAVHNGRYRVSDTARPAAMRARDAIGRTITAVRRERWYNAHAHRVETDTTLILDNGAEIYAHAFEALDQPGAELLYRRPTRAQRRAGNTGGKNGTATN